MKFKIYRCNCRKTWSIQTRKSKFNAGSVLLNASWSAELKPERKRDPKGFVTTQGDTGIIYNPDNELVEQFVKVKKLIYDKKNVNFNVTQGTCLYFAEDGTCYILKRMEDRITVSEKV
ncbi:hypothetical protein M3226_18010 [Neobacillus cucumis]|uniref:hypothetical protein n=1 Tax=Neobacillus cucumis TaxID=1740721 RepID=UPI00203BD09C|nr:hypothetical protein [Neobacillus cucumis]MCM3727574.1 hypothetical protein [Neobacillus cucumis]